LRCVAEAITDFLAQGFASAYSKLHGQLILDRGSSKR
jgi:hypothetical protein